MGFIFNIIFHAACGDNQELALSLILGGPVVPSIMMLVGLWYCPESPRYYMRPRSPNYSPAKAFTILKKLRNTEVCAGFSGDVWAFSFSSEGKVEYGLSRGGLTLFSPS